MDTRQRTALLGETELFDGLDDTALRRLAERARRQVFEKGQTIFVQDEPGDRMFVVVEGVVKLLIRSRSGGFMELVRHGRPAVFGELALLDGGPRSASAEAVERTTLLWLTREDLFEVMRSEPGVRQRLLRSLAAMVRRTTEDLADLAFLDLEGRVARRILALSQRLSGASTETARSRRITQTEIAQMVKGTRQSVNRALRSLERRGFIRLAEDGIEIKDEEGLQRRAGR